MPTERPGAAYDSHLMAVALRLAEEALGTTAPNPSVGCLIVRETDDGPCVLARGATAKGGRPHAETIALERAGDAARGATAYVSLEPCAHHGATPPCADALIAAGIGRAVICCTDPDPRVAGRGIAALRAAGIAVSENVRAAEGRALNAGFFKKVTAGRPLVTLKLATSLDGRIAAKDGSSRWITGEEARRAAHQLRATHDAILIGAGTAFADDPELTCRLPGLEDRSPVRIVADGRLRLPPKSKLAQTAARIPTFVLTRADSPAKRRAALTKLGVILINVAAGQDGALDLGAALQALGAQGMTRLLVEGGATLAGAFLRANLVDRLAWFHGNVVIGGDGVAGVSALSGAVFADLPRFHHRSHEILGEDILDIYETRP